jgi:hypothetical protein
MSTLDAKPVKAKILNTKLLTIAAVILLVLALLFVATPLLSTTTGFAGRTGSNQAFNSPGFSGQGSGIFRLGFLNGVTGTIVYAVALLLSLAAAVGMFMTKRWGKVLGIIMAIIYGLLALVNLLPTLLISFMGIRNPMNLILGIVQLSLTIAVIVLASIPGKKPAAPITPAVPPTVPA